MNRIKRKLKENKKLLSIYFSAGFPKIDDTVEIIKELEENNVDFIAASFVRKGIDVKNLRQLLADNGGQHIKIICKIENQEGLENYDDILRLTDGIMVARGDVSLFRVVY